MKKHLFIIALALLFATTMQAQNIQVNINPEDAGIVEGAGPYSPGDTVALIATANTGYTFLNWTESDTLVSTDITLTLVVGDEDRILFANFEINSYEITASVNPSESGTVSGTGTYDHFEICSLVATPAEGYHFVNWTENGVEVSTSETYSFEVTEAVALVANFEINSYVVTATANPTDGGTVEGTGTYSYGETCTLTAKPNTYYEFSHWSDDSTENPKAFTVINDEDFIAYFVLQLPVINGDISSPEAICSGEELELDTPSVSNVVDTTFWQLSANSSFDTPMVYEGQSLDASYNGWMLRFCAANESGTVYSNTVSISINEINPTLVGDYQICSNEEAEYYVEGADNAICQWTVADSTIYGVGNPFKILWDVNPGVQQLSVFLTDTLTGCTASLEMVIQITSHVTATETLIERSKDGTTYLLIYPNPDSLLYKYQWYYNDQIIPCQKQYLYRSISEGGLDSGSYKVYVSYNQNENGDLICGAFSPEFVVDQPRGPQLSVYPNPSHPNGQITIINEDLEEAFLSIISMDGRLLHSQSIVGRQAVIHLNLPKGIYIAQLKSNQDIKTSRIVIE